MTALVIGIVGSEGAKFFSVTERLARAAIRKQLLLPGVVKAVSGGCHLGGIDIWAREEAAELSVPFEEFKPTRLQWSGPGGYEARNLQIVQASTKVVCITVRQLPPGYKGMRFDWCYHCKTGAHVKSGGCWTMKQAAKRGCDTELIVI